MIEHRLIERMIAIVGRTPDDIAARRSVDPAFVDTVVDFMRTYADRIHHGKEEQIMIPLLETKPISDTDRTIIREIIGEHALGRKITEEMFEANTRYRNGDQAALDIIAGKLDMLAEYYPRHVEKEEKIFFPAARAYVTEEEDQAMIREFIEFDRNFIQDKYIDLVTGLEGR